jgi:HSP20 family protein
MTVFRFEPVREVENLEKKMRQFMSGFPDGINFEVGGFNPKIDLAEDDSKIMIYVELPGVLKEDVKLSFQDNILTIKGEKKNDTEDEKLNFYKLERIYGTFSRSIEIPVDVDMEKISAKFENGLLRIELIKITKEVKEKKIEIL